MKWYEDPVYIKMAEKAVEIQELRNYKYPNSFPGLFRNNDDVYYQVSGWREGKGSIIWLPNQSQLQGMVGIREAFDGMWVRWLRFCVDDTWVIHEYPLRFRASMEQLWLAFVMKEKYGKVWNGEDWVTLR